MERVRLDGAAIDGWEGLHDQCAAAFGFPAFYGRNMDAWIDCLTYVREGDGLSRFALGPHEPLVIDVLGTEQLNRRAPAVLDALAECAAVVNQRQAAAGELPALHIVFR